MAVIITQENRGRKNVYHLKHLDEAGVTIRDETYSVGVEIRTEFTDAYTGVLIDVKVGQHDGGRIVVCVLDENGAADGEAYDYINTLRAVESFKTKKAMGYAIGTYKMFMRMLGYDAGHPTYQNAEEFRNFLIGRNIIPEPGSKVTYRCPSTCGGYMSMVKMYLLLTKNDCSAFENIESRGRKNFVYSDIYGRRRVSSYGRNPHRVKGDPLAKKQLPAHPKPEQVKAILNDALSDPVKGIYWAIYTQFRTGIRRGGVLGLTLEDVCAEKDGDVVEYCIYLRNRISDKEDQFCKNLYHPQSEQEYRTGVYLDSCQRIHISKKLYDGILGYYRETRDANVIGSKKRSLILKNTRADSIYGNMHDNYYIFVHSNGKLLSGQTYNNHLKPLFKAHGVTLDVGFKRYNCSHQLRAAFIMFRGRYSEHPETLLQLARDAGHASPDSTLCYYNEFPEDIMARADQFDRELDELIPETDNVNI